LCHGGRLIGRDTLARVIPDDEQPLFEFSEEVPALLLIDELAEKLAGKSVAWSTSLKLCLRATDAPTPPGTLSENRIFLEWMIRVVGDVDNQSINATAVAHCAWDQQQDRRSAGCRAVDRSLQRIAAVDR
jgi:hypothetical protein